MPNTRSANKVKKNADKGKPPPRRSTRIRRQKTPEPPSSPPRLEEEYAHTTDPEKVTEPVLDLVHRNLKNAWRINKNHSMCFIFDAVNPARQFKRGMLYNERSDFPDYGPEPWDDLTETDTKAPGWMPYKPRVYK